MYNLMADILINVCIAFLAGSLLLGLHRKIMARVQSRPGPPIIQYLLHSLKFFFKESSFPKTVSKPFYLAIVVILCGIWVTAVIVTNVVYGSLLLIFGIYAVHKIVEHNSGSSSGSPYGKLSCVRAVYSAASELPLFGGSILVLYLTVHTMDIGQIISYQAAHGPLIFAAPLAALMFFVTIITKAPYSPFGITLGKDIISGFETEHFGFLRGFIMISESMCWYVLLWLFLTLFFGPLSIIGYVIGMIVITCITGLISATTPMLNPNHSVMSQMTITLIGVVGSIALMII
ncbi:NADH-ubiquinone oxidoreductase [Methanobrevibacter sp. 87.7]|uniref:respiratory chain complex I subunit 1 family protein n=1 Tax=Methanobrevibacter sp. 87.7 TaxID=387957 RepID=UPI000B50E030|nr:NADH-quinone oxidoreductase subunit H [Methanobrevibacter sp. 87.7]OWT33534.1 NADH-ubiquinone oxidoreductase [Methanobrevibacter sp. 87.7]